MTLLSLKETSPSRYQSYTKELYIAFLSFTLIFVHLVLRFAFHTTPFIYDFPLFMALAFGGTPLVYTLVKKFLKLEFSSDLLAGISIITAIILEQYLAGTIVVLMLSGGQALEMYAIRRASYLLEALANRMPSIAHLKKNHTLKDVAIDQIEVGDILEIHPHEICPVDGTVVEGHGVMDESYLTGEPFLIAKTPGSLVLSGSINGDSVFAISCTKKAKDSRYAKIMQVMIESEQKKPNIRRLGDLLGSYYTPFALLIAFFAWWLSGESMRFLAVLVIATPCPLLLGIPVAIIGAISLSAKNGIIIKNPAVLEQIAKCTTIIFDKTGTLTYGKPQITEILHFNGFSKDDVLSLAASLERYSKHPLANPIICAAKNAYLPLFEVTHISEKPGEGLIGTVNEHEVVMTSRGQLVKKGKIELAQRLKVGTGLECVLLVDGKLAGHFRFHDVPREDSHSFVSHLGPMHQFNRIMIVSGDREVEVRYLADKIGISEIYTGKSPEEKVAIVQEETKKNKVIYLGDGINDAPALAVSTVGIAFGQNSDITSEAADAVILDNSLKRVDELLHISSRMRKIALQSAVGGMALSVIGMVFAAYGFLPPVAGALTQEIIDVFAVLNALRVAFPRGQLADYS